MLEGVEPFVGEAEEIRLADLQVMRLHHRVVHRLRQQLQAHFFFVGGAVGANEAALAGQRLDDALVLELGVGPRYRVAIDAKFFRQRPDRWQRLTGMDRAGGRRGFDLVDELEIDRLAGFETEIESHHCTNCHMTVGQLRRFVKSSDQRGSGSANAKSALPPPSSRYWRPSSS